MDKVTFNILDDIFSHDKYSVAGRDSKYITWDRGLLDKSKPTFYSHNRIPDIVKHFTDKNNSYAIIFESRSIVPDTYVEVEKFLPMFNKVFTHNSEFLQKYDNCHWIPGGGVWVGGSYGKGVIKLFDKSKLCSIVSSHKQMCDLHRYRLEITKYVMDKGFDVFGLNSWQPIHKSLDDYMFSIVIENFQDEMYFTEKILNCFATGTIPIYFGAKNIGDKFNIDGILTFSSTEELLNILDTISPELYKEKQNSIKDNFERVNDYLSIEDYIYLNFFNGK